MLGPGNLFGPRTGRPWLASATDLHPSWSRLAWSTDDPDNGAEACLWPRHRTDRRPYRQPARLSPRCVGLGGVVKVSPPFRTDKLYLTLSASHSPQPATPRRSARSTADRSVPCVGSRAGQSAARGGGQSTPFQLNCGSGPLVSVMGMPIRTSVSGTLANLIGSARSACSCARRRPTVTSGRAASSHCGLLGRLHYHRPDAER